MADAHKEYVECVILHDSQSIFTKIRFIFSQIKKSADIQLIFIVEGTGLTYPCRFVGPE